MNFLDYLLKNNISNKLYLLGFVIAVMSYSFWQPLEDALKFSENNQGSVFFIGIAFAFCCYTSAYMFSNWNKWRWFPMFVTLICLSRLFKELYYVVDEQADPTQYDIFDYINSLITLFIVFNYYISYRHKKYKNIKK